MSKRRSVVVDSLRPWADRDAKPRGDEFAAGHIDVARSCGTGL